MSDLWAPSRAEARGAVEPLAVRMRPRTLDEVVGQRHLLGESGGGERPLLRRMIEGRTLTSIVLHGPPGTGKTTLAGVIANETGGHLVRENAASVGVKRIREVIEASARRVEEGLARSILFLDEIHRFSRAQQDVLLEDVERGLVTLIGATTENPLFSVNSALLSRSTLFRLEPLSEEEVVEVVRRALADKERGYGGKGVRVTEGALRVWAVKSEGDARRALTALEVAVRSGGGGPVEIDERSAEEAIQEKVAVYGDDQHYDHASALIKSVRGSDPDAAVYWLAVMLEGGEDPRFIARRLAILASEDVGNADPRAVVIAQSCWDLVERIGMPEARITLAQCAVYLSLAPKSNASYKAIERAIGDVRGGRVTPVPMFLRSKNKPRSEGSEVEGRGYEYSHGAGVETSIGGVTGQGYLGVEERYYEPTGIGSERLLRERLEEVRAARRRARGGGAGGAGGG